MYRRHSSISKTTKNREFEKAQEEIKETRGALYEYQVKQRT
jgi:hypothetical protein